MTTSRTQRRRRTELRNDGEALGDGFLKAQRVPWHASNSRVKRIRANRKILQPDHPRFTPALSPAAQGLACEDVLRLGLGVERSRG